MTEREALKLALEALEKSHTCPLLPDDCAEAITAIKEALAQPEHGWTPERIAGMARLKDAQDKRLAQPSVSVEQEPVAWMNDMGTHIDLNVSGRGTPLYTTPRQRKPLTDEEIGNCIDEVNLTSEYGHHHFGWHKQFARAIEAAHGIKGEA